MPLNSDTPAWPYSPGVRLRWSKRLDAGDECNNSRLDCDVHVGTHVDAPWHFLEDGVTVEQLPLDVLIGPAVVVYLPEVAAVTVADLEALDLSADVQRLLLRTRNFKLWATYTGEFHPDFTALTVDATQWAVRRGIRLLGIDYLSVQRFGDGPQVHQILLEAGMVIVEGLNLIGVEPGDYELICLPLKLIGAEGAPARAMLRKHNGKDSL